MKLTLEQQQKGQELYKELVQKAREEATFKEELIKHPEATISDFLGREFKGDIVIEDQTNPDVIYFNIPRKPNLDELELSDEQLDIVSGGEAPFLIAAGIGFVAGVAFMAAAAGVAAVVKAAKAK